MDVPADPPDVCPVCDRPFESVSRHAGGLMVNLLDNERYRRVCFDPVAVDDVPHVDFYHHNHDQTDRADDSGRSSAVSETVDTGDVDRPTDPVGTGTGTGTGTDPGTETGTATDRDDGQATRSGAVPDAPDPDSRVTDPERLPE
jgi:hypothetical protein